MKTYLATLLVLIGPAAKASQTFCGVVSISNVGVAAVMPDVFLSVPNQAIPEAGYTTNFRLEDDFGGDLVLKIKKLNGKNICVSGSQIASEDGQATINIESISE